MLLGDKLRANCNKLIEEVEENNKLMDRKIIKRCSETLWDHSMKGRSTFNLDWQDDLEAIYAESGMHYKSENGEKIDKDTLNYTKLINEKIIEAFEKEGINASYDGLRPTLVNENNLVCGTIIKLDWSQPVSVGW